MYYLFLLTTICLIGIPQRGSTESRISQHDGIVQIDFGSSDTRQLRELEKTFTDVLKKFIKKDPTNFIQRSKSHSNNGLKLNLRHISKLVFEEIKSALTSLGLMRPKKNRGSLMHQTFAKHRPHNSTKFVEFEFGSATAIVNIIKEIIFKTQNFLSGVKYRRRGYAPSKFTLPKSVNRGGPDDLQITHELVIMRDYIEALLGCLTTSKSSKFNIKDAFGKLTKLLPETTVRVVKARLKKKVPRHPRTHKGSPGYNEFQAMICLGLAKKPKRDFEPCLKQLRAVDHCTLGKSARSVTIDKSFSNSSQRLIQNIDDLDTDCKVTNNTTSLRLVCKNDSKEANLPRSDPVLEKIFNMLEVYQQAQRKRRKLRIIAQNDQHAKKEYQKLSRSLADYETNLMDVGLQAIKLIHQIATTVEKTFVDTALRSTGVDLSENLRSMRCIFDVYDYMLYDLHHNHQHRPYHSTWDVSYIPWQGGYSQNYYPHSANIYDESVEFDSDTPTNTATTKEGLDHYGEGYMGHYPYSPNSIPEDYNELPLMPEGHETFWENEESDESPENIVHPAYIPYHGILDDESGRWMSYEDYPKHKNKALGAYKRSSSADQPSWVTPWLESMKRLARVETRRKPSTIMTLANTFVLATMFYECIVILAATISQTESSEKPTPPPVVLQPMRPDHELMSNGDDDDDETDYSDYSGQRKTYGRKEIRRSLKDPLDGRRYKHDVTKQESMVNIDDKPSKKKVYNRKLII